MTLDQLQYIIERKYNNIKMGSDVIIACTLTKTTDGRQLIKNSDAKIIEWNINYLNKPSDSEIDDLWNKLSDQYHADPTRIDSAMYKHTNTIDSTLLEVTVNNI